MDDPTGWPLLSWPPPPGLRLTGRVVELAAADPDRDAAELFAALDDDRVWEHVAGRPADADRYAATLRGALDVGTLPWTVRLRRPYGGLPAGAVAGITSYLDVSPVDARLEIGGTAYRPELWGSAVNPDTKLLLLGYAFEPLHAARVQLKTDVRNLRSRRAIAGLGARYEGTLRSYQRRADGTLRDTVLFSVIAAEWPAVRDRLLHRLAAAGDTADPTGL